MSILTLNGITLNNNLFWEDRWSFQTADKTVTRTLGGNVVTFNASLIKGRPITLVATEDQGWLTLTQVEQMAALADVAGAIYSLVIPRLGTQLLDQPTFDQVGTWVVVAPWSIANGYATIDGSQVGAVSISQAGISNRDNSKYEVKYRVSGYTAGTVTPGFITVAGTPVSSDGVFTEVIQEDNVGGVGTFSMSADSAFIGQIDYVELRLLTEITENVQFRHDEAPAFNAVPLIPRQMAQSADYFTATIKLMTV